MEKYKEILMSYTYTHVIYIAYIIMYRHRRSVLSH